MTHQVSHPVVLVHADESCLGNQNATPSRGGASAFVEMHSDAGIDRKDFYLSSPDTTNNRMALIGASKLMALITGQIGTRVITYCSDSQYLVKGMNEWIHSWKARSWNRRGGPIENLEMWQTLDRAAAQHRVTFKWVRGHAGNPKNEYADHLAVRAAELQTDSGGLVKSGWDGWILDQNRRGAFANFNADDHFYDITRTPSGR